MDLTEVRGKVDFGIITIREDEFEAVLARFPPTEQVTGHRQYNLHRVPLPGGDSYLVAMVRCIEQGTIEAQSVARDLLEDLNPHWLLVVGIAGGVPRDEFSLGDVVVSIRVHDFSVEAVLQGRPPEYALAGGPVDKTAATHAANLLARKAQLGTWNSAESIGVPRPAVPVDDTQLYGDESWRHQVRKSLARNAGRTHPMFVTGAIASSDRLMKDTETLALWMKMARQELAIEMESAGVYRATYGRQVPTLSIRGISDIIGLQRDSAWTRYACHTAAAFASALMQTRPFEPRSPSLRGVLTQKIRALVARFPFPRVSEVDPYHLLGVTESALAKQYAPQDARPPYVLRDIDSELDTALLTSDLVLLVGHSKSGKSRTAYEAALRLYPQQPLLIPSDGKALAKLFSLEPPVEWGSNPAIVWLDDLQRFLGPNGLTVSLLNVLSQDKERLKLLATLTSQRYEDIRRAAGDVEKDIQLTLRRFREVHLASELSLVETQRAAARYPQEPKEKLADGLGEYLVAAHELLMKYDTAKATCPQGYALVRAAIDWRRAGLLRPIPETALQKLASRYARFLKLPHVDMTAEAFSEGLHWAREPIGLHTALLSASEGDISAKSFEAFDYLVDHLDRTAVGIPEEAWEAILQFASPAETITVVLNAYQRQNKTLFRKVLDRVMQSGDGDIKAQAAYALGTLHQKEGNLPEAESAYRLATDSKKVELASSAMLNIGIVRHQQGDFKGAEGFYHRALESQVSGTVAQAAYNLGLLSQDQSQLDEAERFFQKAISLHQPDTSFLAALKLGKTFLDQREFDKAERVYQDLSRSSNSRDVAVATVNLGRVQQLRGKLTEAERLYRQAIASNQDEAVPLAMNNLGLIIAARGELDEAERLYRQAVSSHHPEAAPLATLNLGAIFHTRGDLAQAEQFYREALESKEPLSVAHALNYLGKLLQQRGDRAEARRLFQQALDAKVPEVVPFATLNMGSLLVEDEKYDEAAPYLQRAIATQHADVLLPATLFLGTIRAEQGQEDEAERLYREVIDSKRLDLYPAATYGLGRLLQDQGRHAEAEQFLQQTINSRNPDLELDATLLLGLSLAQRAEFATAEKVFRKVVDSKHPEYLLAASCALGAVLEKQGDLVAAEHLYRAAHESKNDSVAAAAAVRLGMLLLHKGAFAEARGYLEKAARSSDEDSSAEARAALASLSKP